MSRRTEQRKWGIRTLLFLALAAASIIISNWMRMTGNTDVILLTFIGTVVGLVGGAVCSLMACAPGAASSPAKPPRTTAASARSRPGAARSILGCNAGPGG
ncbi:MAG TPA: hypothetical protein VEY96_08600 [Actinomycetes bacterium]|nr:hypothetical protein [Actinomycetes bacterium]